MLVFWNAVDLNTFVSGKLSYINFQNSSVHYIFIFYIEACNLQMMTVLFLASQSLFLFISFSLLHWWTWSTVLNRSQFFLVLISEWLFSTIKFDDCFRVLLVCLFVDGLFQINDMPFYPIFNLWMLSFQEWFFCIILR